jgi:mannitol-specific phosphotransferase system IIBC component
MRDLLVYSVLRLGLWLVLWWVITLFDVGVLLAGVLAALIALLLSMLLLKGPRSRTAQHWQEADERRQARKAAQGEPDDADAAEEDALLDAEADARSAVDPDANAQSRGDFLNGETHSGRS